jgi:hypothetical protein
LAGLTLFASVSASFATEHVVSSFQNSSDTALWIYQNWDQSVGTIAFSTDDANGSASSGSMKMTTTFNVGTNGGAYRLNVNNFNASAYTALEYDVKVDPNSGVDQYGTAVDFKMGVFSVDGGNSYQYHANDLNISKVSTNNGWQHIVLPAGTLGKNSFGWTNLNEVFIQWYDNNYLSATTAVVYVDNIKFTGPDPTYPNFTGFTFDNSTTLAGVVTNWYGNPLGIEWATNDALGNPNSGSFHMVANYAPGDNNFVCAVPFDTNFDTSFATPETNAPGVTNVINGRNYQAVELDVLWDTNLSTVSIDEFNQKGDIGGFPLGLLVNQGGAGGGQVEAFGGAAPNLPGTASNQWVHMSIPLNRTAPGIDQTIGLWLKKYNWGSVSGTVAFYMDNVVFIGAPLEVPRPTLSISKPIRGLQCVSTGTGNNPPYDRESIVTFGDTYTFVDQANPVSYNINIASMPPTNYAGYSTRIYWVPTGVGVPGTAPEPDWVYPNVLFAEIQRTTNGSTVQLHCKTNSANGNGSFYVSGNPQFDTTSAPEGNWTFTFTGNTGIAVRAPNGSSTNLVFPLNFTSTDVETYFFNAGMVAYYGAVPNGTANEGQRVVLAGAGFTNGASSFYDNFATDTVLDINTGGGGLWLLASDTARTDGLYLLTDSTKYFLDWTVNGGTDFQIQTNSALANSSGWSTNLTLTSALVADHFHSEVDVTNLPSGGNMFFRVAKPSAP